MTIRILYNAECPICNAEICHYRAYAEKRDIPFGFDDLNIVDPSEYGVTQDQAARRLHILHEGQVYSGMPAFRIIWAQMPRYKILSIMTSMPILRPFSNFVYDRVLAPWLYRRHLSRIKQ
jgi:predicted DCC family thiol-disulfide oxidoreductase YuxK